MTERRLAQSMQLDRMSSVQIVELMHAQDKIAVEAVGQIAPEIARAVDLITEAFSRGGRLFYIGAGTSGRLGVLDASECPPTFRSDPQQVQGIIAGGMRALVQPCEGAEDDAAAGAAAIRERKIGKQDVVVGIAAGGTTPYVLGALKQARQCGARTIFLTCVQDFADAPIVDVLLRPITGPEVLTGSTRLKAGTATKLVLNMLSTGAMVRSGKCYENLMVDMAATNQKLWDRGARTVAMLSGLDKPAAMALLKKAEGHVKPAVVMHRLGVDLDEARRQLAEAGGRLREVLMKSSAH